MATNTETITLGDLRHPCPTYRSTTGGESGSFNVYNGSIAFSVQPGQGGKAIYRARLRPDELFVITQIMEKMPAAEPNTDKTLVFNDRERQPDGKFIAKLRCVFIFKKDERKVLHIILKGEGGTWDFPIRLAGTTAFGTGEIPEDVRSQYEWAYLISFLKNTIPMQVELSAVRMTGQLGQGGQQGGGYGGNRYQGGGYNRGGQGGGNRYPRPNASGEFTDSSALPSDADMFGGDK